MLIRNMGNEKKEKRVEKIQQKEMGEIQQKEKEGGGKK